jgi:tRNA A-37 threonylcarbamoyl transferase component Bud32
MLDIDIENERIVKEFIDGPTVFEMVRDSERELDEAIFSEIREMAKIAKAAGLNIDYFPTNFVLQGEKLYYIDYECNEYMDEWNFENWGIKYWSKTEEFQKYIELH